MALINTTTTGVLGSTFYGDGTGPLNIQQNGVTLGIYGNIPAFSAYFTGNPGITASTWTKMASSIEDFDTANCYDNTNYRFTPNVAGYYMVLVSAVLYGPNVAQYTKMMAIYKNGAFYRKGTLDGYFAYANNNTGVQVNALVYLNGTTDYVEAYGYMEQNGNFIGGNSSNIQNIFQSYLVKAA